MIRVKAKETFTLNEFKKVKNLKRGNGNEEKDGWIFKNDEFECEEGMAKYLLNETPNPVGREVVELIEYKPEKEEKKEKKKTTKRGNSIDLNNK